MSKITISSLNVRGLVNSKKRREIFQWLKKKNVSIYTLQEAHCTTNYTLGFGRLNGAAQFFSAAWQATKQVSKFKIKVSDTDLCYFCQKA